MTIVIATGASGGHIYPALAVADVLREQGREVVFVGVFRQWIGLIERAGYDAVELPLARWDIKSLNSVPASAGSMLQSLTSARKIVSRRQPDRIAGFGGYGSVPVVLAGWLKRIPVVIHEQNVRPGRANMILSRFARRVMVTFPDSVRHFSSRKTIVSGYPLRQFSNAVSRQACLREFGFDPEVLTVAVCGGSQGSRALNHAMVQAAGLLKDEERGIQILHIAGEQDAGIVAMGYARLGIRHRVVPFTHEIETFYAAADVAVIRAGAGVLHEAAYFGLPAVVVPYPYAGAHQRNNALAFVRTNTGLMIEEKSLTARQLCAGILGLARTARDPVCLTERNPFLAPGAAEQIAGIITGDRL